MPSSRRGAAGSPPPNSGPPPEILHQLGRAVLSYTLKKLNEQTTQGGPREQSSRRRSSRSRTRDASRGGDRASSRGGDLPRSDSSDMHALISQLAVGLCAFGIRHLIRRRREAKRRAAAEGAAGAATTARDVRSGRGQSQGQRQGRQGSAAVDPELSAALDTVTRELKGASESIRRLARTAPSHRRCDVRDALVADAERLSGSLANVQASIHNMRNLHPALDRGSRPRESVRGTRPDAQQRARTKAERLSTRENTARSRGSARMEERASGESDGSRWERSRRRGLPAERHRSRPGSREKDVRERRWQK
ncbi:499a52b2-1968-4e93-8be2-86611eca12a1 [Thermothielavioides terrestris]|uniref:Uncharacterized protein n=2 Tax=Thermothielavioides terrestris TaxID=2587410 RepID=G2RAT6_THETT|nr:uncharacterized protein THITE_156426 [Thermothielavioides terrestris NRRL 8126]AEO69767.1 hypothetical protein THITE_156426 [Thermothielavioides terrestris NRRL 8126]SPQ26310.1 499a52b2-1968-4e93-8be2-86611eca12a1 [Thermothielavioides terrestris]